MLLYLIQENQMQVRVSYCPEENQSLAILNLAIFLVKSFNLSQKLISNNRTINFKQLLSHIINFLYGKVL